MALTPRAALTAAVLAGLWPACAERPREPLPAPPAAPAIGVPQCPSAEVDNYLAKQWQRCWFEAAGGRWRTLSHEFHYDVLVVEVEAASLDDAGEILRRFIDVHRERFNDITVYVHQEPAWQPGPIRRLHWLWDREEIGTLEFTGARGRYEAPGK